MFAASHLEPGFSINTLRNRANDGSVACRVLHRLSTGRPQPDRPRAERDTGPLALRHAAVIPVSWAAAPRSSPPRKAPASARTATIRGQRPESGNGPSVSALLAQPTEALQKRRCLGGLLRLVLCPG